MMTQFVDFEGADRVVCNAMWRLLAAATAAVALSPQGVIERRAILGGAALSAQSSLARPATATLTQSGAELVLSDGVSFPLVSFGLQVYDDERARRLTLTALDCGYRNFFASVLAGNQRGFGKAIRESGIPRSQIFVCGSVLSNRARGYDAAFKSTQRGCEENLAALGVGKLDMIMLDYPGADADSIRGQWAAFEQMKLQGQVRSLAVSNFNPTQLDVIVGDGRFATKPSVNQLPYGVGYKAANNRRLLQENANRGILVQSWSPLRVVSPSAKTECGKIGRTYGKSAQQVALRWILQHGAAFTCTSSNKAHFLEDIDLFDFKLSDADMASLDSISS